MDQRKELIKRLSDFSLPSIWDREYIYIYYFFKDLKYIFDKYIFPGNKIFDIGCGNKPYEKYIRYLIKSENKNSYVGSDIVQSSEQKVDIICDATNIPEESCLYDVVISTQVIEHVFNHEKVFDEAYRLLKPGGYFIVSSNFIWRMHEKPYDYYRFTKYSFESLLTDSKFKIIESKSNGGKWSVLGQLFLLISLTKYDPKEFILKRKLKTIIRRLSIYICNTLFLWLDRKKYDDSEFTLNYIFVGQK